MTAAPQDHSTQTDEQYLDALIANEGCDMDKTPGFRDFVLDLMATIGERPRAARASSVLSTTRRGMAREISPASSTIFRLAPSALARQAR